MKDKFQTMSEQILSKNILFLISTLLFEYVPNCRIAPNISKEVNYYYSTK